MNKKAGVFISTPFFAMVGRAGGMIIPFFIAFCYGVSYETDAFFFAYAFVFFAGALFQQILESVMVPYFAEQRKLAEGRDFRMAVHVSAVIIPGVLAAALLLALAMHYGLGLWSGLSHEARPLAVTLFLEMIPFLLLAVGASAVNGLFNTRKIFWYPAVSPLIRSVIVVAVLLLHSRFGIHALSIGFAAGEAVRCMTSFYLLKKFGGIASGMLSGPRLLHGRQFWADTGVQILAMAGVQMTTLVNQWFSTWLGAGEVTLFSYADRLAMIPSQIFIAGISQIFLAHWSDAALENNPDVFRARVTRETRIAFFTALGVSIFLWGVREPVVRLVYAYGGFDPRWIPKVADTFGWLILGFAPAVLNSLYLRVLFVMRHPAFFCLQSWVKLGLQCLLNAVLIKSMGIEGAALGTSLSSLTAALWIFWYVERNWSLVRRKTV